MYGITFSSTRRKKGNNKIVTRESGTRRCAGAGCKYKREKWMDSITLWGIQRYVRDM